MRIRKIRDRKIKRKLTMGLGLKNKPIEFFDDIINKPKIKSMTEKTEEKTETKFSYKKMIFKGVKYLVLYGLPYLVATLIKFYPEIMSLSIGTLLTMVINMLKVRLGIRLP